MQFDFEQQGSGPALLFVPGSFSTWAAWRGIHEHLKGKYRIISTSLPGYGGSAEIRPDDVSSMDFHNEFVSAVAKRIDEPFHCISHSFGGLTSFSAVISGAVKPLSMITFEANPAGIRLDGEHFAWYGELSVMIDGFRRAIADGDPSAAGIIIDFWSGAGTFAAMPEKFQEFCHAVVTSNLLDWQSAFGFTPELSKYAEIEVPCTVVQGAFAVPQMAELSSLIAGALPNGSLKTVAGAGHFLTNTHAKECAAIIDAHMTQHFPVNG